MQQSKIRYRIVLVSLGRHLIEVECRISNPSKEGQRFSLPVWAPGSYLIREFSKNIVSIQATSQDMPVALTKLTKNTWQSSPCSGELVITYGLYAHDPSIRTAYLDQFEGFLNGPAVFIRVLGLENEPMSVSLEQPMELSANNWSPATSLTPLSITKNGFGTYQAANYDDLIDHPIQLGPLQRFDFTVGDTSHKIAVSSNKIIDLEKISKHLQAICNEHVALFGTLPADRYVFLVRALEEGFGGLEHKYSCALLCKHNDLAHPQDPNLEPYRSFLGLCSHEYFHLWNVKRLKPSELAQINYDEENYTQLLWFFEGFTSYYDDLALVRSGLITEESYLDLLGRNITKVLKIPGRYHQTLEEASFDAWIKYYRPDENTPNTTISYYQKGAMLALATDLTIRLRTAGKHSLDQVMRHLWAQHGPGEKGITKADIFSAIDSISAQSLSSELEPWIASTDDLPVFELLEQFGISHLLRPAERDHDDHGLATPEQLERITQKGWLGWRVKSDIEQRIFVSYTYVDGPAMNAQISTGDEVVSVAGMRVTYSKLGPLLSQYAPGCPVEIALIRNGREFRVNLIMGKAPLEVCTLYANPNSARENHERRALWLKSNRNSV